MFGGSIFEKAFTSATGVAKQAASTIATGADWVGKQTAQAASAVKNEVQDGAGWVKDTTGKMADRAGQDAHAVGDNFGSLGKSAANGVDQLAHTEAGRIASQAQGLADKGKALVDRAAAPIENEARQIGDEARKVENKVQSLQDKGLAAMKDADRLLATARQALADPGAALSSLMKKALNKAGDVMGDLKAGAARIACQAGSAAGKAWNNIKQLELPQEDKPYNILDATKLTASLTHGILDTESFEGIKSTLYDKELAKFGNQANQLTIGKTEASLTLGKTVDDEGSTTYGAGLEGHASVAEYDGKAEYKGVTGHAHAEILSADGEIDAGVVRHADGSVAAKAEAGVEVYAVKGSVDASTKITAKGIYDKTIGSLVGFAFPGSKYATAPAWADHGIVVGVGGEAGFGAAAKASAEAGELENGTYGVKLGLEAGYGPMAGIKAIFGFV